MLLGTANINSPVIFPFPAAGLPNPWDRITTRRTRISRASIVGDTIRFTDAWAARAGVSQDWFHVDNYNARRWHSPEYSNHGLSPTASLMYKPVSNMTVYATFASSLQAGDLGA